MRKSVLLPALAVAGGIVGLLVRRVYLANGFEVGTGLPIAGAPSLWAMALVAVAVVVVLAVLSCPGPPCASPSSWRGWCCWPSGAFSPWPTGCRAR